MASVPADREKASFAEEALRLGGKSAEEVRRMGAVDKADEQVETLFAPQYQTTSSPIHRAVWDGKANRVYVNGVKFDDIATKAFKRVDLGSKEYFVLGDNRDNSHDSRQFGFVPLGDVQGFVQYIYLPAETWARFGVYRDWP